MVHVRLLGPPSIEGPDGPRVLRGHKAWAVLARLTLAERPVDRRDLAAELFPETVDPLGSLRWCLAGIRKALGAPDAFTGDPIDVTAPAGVTFDVREALAGRLDPADHGGELLQGLDPRCGPEFTTWLLIARQQLAARAEDELREATIVALSRGAADRALGLAEQLVRRAPYDEGAHVLLVRSLVAAGHDAAARAHMAAAEQLFRDELGIEPSDAIRSAGRREVADPPPGVTAGTLAATLLDAGRSALAAGATDAGVDCLRRAASGAEQAGDRALHAECLLALGSALVRSVRGFDDEGSILLEQAAHLATEAGDGRVAASALQERAYADALAGRRPEAARRLEAAEALADGDDALLAGVRSTIAFNLADWGRTEEALERYAGALESAQRASDRRRQAWIHGLSSWALLHDGRSEEASVAARASLDLVRSLGWTSFEPFPAAVLAEASAAASGQDLSPGAGLERVFAMSCELADPCWEGAAGRAMALALAAADRHDEALRWITDARVRSVRRSDAWAGLVGVILLTEVSLRTAAGDAAGAEAAARDAVALAARSHLDGMLPAAVGALGRAGAGPVSPARPAPGA